LQIVKQQRRLPIIDELLASSPGVLLTGPRQCGKTTLAKTLGSRYLDLEQVSDRVRLDATWNEVMASPGLTILDEAQCWPELFPRLRGAIDAERERKGRFLLLGSVSPALMRTVADSLAGRLALIEMGPFNLGEVGHDQLDRLWLTGGFPEGGILAEGRFPGWQRDYLALLAARDLPQWGISARPQMIDRLMAMLAVVHGQQWNASQIGQGLGLSYHTVDAYVDVLEGAGLVRRLRPYAANVGKRLVRRPKLYWRDSGLLHGLLGIVDRDALLRQPWVGASWEGFVITQILDTVNAHGQRPSPTFLRTSDGIEADLVLERPNGLMVIEIKLTSAPNSDDVAALRRASACVGTQQPVQSVLVSRQGEIVEGNNLLLCPLTELLRRLET
jgi:uncharacterized protein